MGQGGSCLPPTRLRFRGGGRLDKKCSEFNQSYEPLIQVRGVAMGAAPPPQNQSERTVFESLAWFWSTKDLVPLFYPKVHLFENSLLKILAQLLR